MGELCSREQVHQSSDQIGSESQLGAYLFRVLPSTCVHFLRPVQTRRRIEPPPVDHELGTLIQTENDPVRGWPERKYIKQVDCGDEPKGGVAIRFAGATEFFNSLLGRVARAVRASHDGR